MRCRHDVAIYAPEAAGLYERQPRETGGAEVQTALLARALAERGLRTAHIVFPVADPAPTPGGPTIVARAEHAGGPLGPAREARRIWRALAEADAGVNVFRMSSPALGVVAAFCRRRGRGLVFASANDYDFTFERISGPLAAAYRYGVRNADQVVVQTAEQARLAADAFPGVVTTEIASFAEPAEATTAAPEAFLWTARLVDYKQPLRYLDLAAAVPEARFRMIAVQTGESAPELASELLRRSAELPNLELLEPRGRRDLLPLVDRTVAVVSTSRLEGMPNVFLEGWARGVPALSLSFDPDGRIAREGLGVAAEGDFDRFVAAARDLWARRGERPWARATRDYIQRTHSIEAVGARWAKVVAAADPR